MASFASIISILVLLAAYGYSVPLESVFQTSTYPTSKFEFTTGKTIVNNADKINAHLMTREEAEKVPLPVIPQGFMNKYTLSTPASLESHERDSRESPLSFEKFSTSSPVTNTAAVPSSEFPPRGIVVNNLLDTTSFRPSTSAEETVTPKVTLPKRGIVVNNLLDTTTFRPSTSAEATVTPKVTLPKRAFESKERFTDKSTSAEVLLTTPVSGVDSKESTSAERVNIRPLEATTRKSMGLKNPTSGSAEADRSSEESKIRGPQRVTPFIPLKGQKPLVV